MTDRNAVGRRRLIVVTGVPGSGKSTLAAALADALPGTIVCLDVVKERLFAQGETDPAQLRMDAEVMLFDDIAAIDGVVVVDIWVSPRRDTERVTMLLRETARDVIEVHCTVPSGLAVERYASRRRGAPHLPPDASTLQRIREAADDPVPLGIGFRVEVDTSRTVDMEQVLARLASVDGT